MNEEWIMPEWMHPYIQFIWVYDDQDKLRCIEYSMNKPFMAKNCDDACVRTKIKMLEEMYKAKLIK